MTDQEIADLLKNELKQGEVTVTSCLFPSQCRIDWNVKGLNVVMAVDMNIIMNDVDTIKEELIKPTALKLKMYMRIKEREVK